MKFQIITIGEPKKFFIKDGVDEYLTRLKGVTMAEYISIKDNKNAYQKVAKTCEKTFVVAMHEHGKQMSSRQLARFLEELELEGTGTMSLVVGPADGHPDEFIASCDYTLALSKLTLPHELAFLVLLEAMYRAVSIRQRHPYHRD